jgi:hypothetical protein
MTLLTACPVYYGNIKWMFFTPESMFLCAGLEDPTVFWAAIQVCPLVLLLSSASKLGMMCSLKH